MNLEDKLTILIPTYNREQRLTETLRSISNQGHWGEYSIVIVDNCSNYSVVDSIRNNFEEEFVDNITVHRWFFNTGMSTNISIAFEFVNTKWCWFISDDDEILDGALNTLLSDAKCYPTCAAIKYSIKDICRYDNSTIHDVEEWSRYYFIHSSGDKGYLSMLYNIEVIYPYLSELTVHSYSYLSFWLPVLRALNETSAIMIMSSDVLFKYKSNNDGWSSSNERYLNTLVGIRTFFDSKYSLSEKTFEDFKRVFLDDLFSARSVIIKILYMPNRDDRKYYYFLLKQYLSGSFIDFCLAKPLYYVATYLNISPNTIKRIISANNG